MKRLKIWLQIVLGILLMAVLVYSFTPIDNIDLKDRLSLQNATNISSKLFIQKIYTSCNNGTTALMTYANGTEFCGNVAISGGASSGSTYNVTYDNIAGNANTCPSGQVVNGFYLNGSPKCAVDATTSGGTYNTTYDSYSSNVSQNYSLQTEINIKNRYGGNLTTNETLAAQTNLQNVFLTNWSRNYTTDTLAICAINSTLSQYLDINNQKFNESNFPKNWTDLKNYPVACPAGSAVTTIDDSITCTAFSQGGSGGAGVTLYNATNELANYINATAVNHTVRLTYDGTTQWLILNRTVIRAVADVSSGTGIGYSGTGYPFAAGQQYGLYAYSTINGVKRYSETALIINDDNSEIDPHRVNITWASVLNAEGYLLHHVSDDSATVTTPAYRDVGNVLEYDDLGTNVGWTLTAPDVSNTSIYTNPLIILQGSTLLDRLNITGATNLGTLTATTTTLGAAAVSSLTSTGAVSGTTITGTQIVQGSSLTTTVGTLTSSVSPLTITVISTTIFSATTNSLKLLGGGGAVASSIAEGVGARTQSANSLALGNNCFAGMNSVQDSATCIGNGGNASHRNSLTIGTNAKALAYNGIALGTDSMVLNDFGLAISGGNTSGWSDLSVGRFTQTTGGNTTYLFGAGESNAKPLVNPINNSFGIGFVAAYPTFLYSNEHLEFNGTLPKVYACGTSPKIYGNDMVGNVTIGTGVVSSCSIGFAKAWTAPPTCDGSDSGTILNTRFSANTSTLIMDVATTFTAGDSVTFGCIGRLN